MCTLLFVVIFAYMERCEILVTYSTLNRFSLCLQKIFCPVVSKPRIFRAVLQRLVFVTDLSHSVPGCQKVPGPNVVIVGKLFDNVVDRFVLLRVNVVLFVTVSSGAQPGGVRVRPIGPSPSDVIQFDTLVQNQ